MSSDWIGSDVNQVEPISLSHISGQKHLIDALQVQIRAYFNIRSVTGNANQSFGPVALVGPSGTGKTLVAKAIHAELGNLRLYQTNGETINSKCEQFTILLKADEHSTIFIDEAQGMNSKTQHILLTAISEKFLPINIASYGHPFGIQLKGFTLILASTHEHLLQEALRNRVRIYCRFRHYSVQELVDIVQQRANTLGWLCESPEVLLRIAQRAKGNARLALNKNLQMCWQVSQSHDHDVITLKDLQEAFFHLRVDEFGLDEIDRQYLEVLAETERVPLNVIGSKLGLPTKTIQQVIEPYLIRESFITKDHHSMRMLTVKGKKHIESIPFGIKERK